MADKYINLYDELYNSGDKLLLTLVKHQTANTRSWGEQNYEKFILTFIKYLVWNVKSKMLPGFPRENIESARALRMGRDETLQNTKYITPLIQFSPLNSRTLVILASTTTFFNTDSCPLIPGTGPILPIVNDMVGAYNKKNERKLAIVVEVENEPKRRKTDGPLFVKNQ